MVGHDTTRERTGDHIDPAWGYTDDGSNFVPGVNCYTCGRFVGRDGYIGIDYFEMSNTVASVEGECARCLARPDEGRGGDA